MLATKTTKFESSATTKNSPNASKRSPKITEGSLLLWRNTYSVPKGRPSRNTKQDINKKTEGFEKTSTSANPQR